MKKNQTREILRLDKVSKIYMMGEGVIVKGLDNVSLTIKENELACILGPSGSGKSTMLHMLGLLDSPTKGKRYINGVDTSTLNEDELAKARGDEIGFIFQTFNLLPSLTAYENVVLPLMILDEYTDEKKRYAKELLEKLGLGKRFDHLPSQLSGGERQRVAIARAIVNKPEIILADEPTGNLDSKSGVEVLKILKELHKEGRTVVIITHDINVAKIAKRIIKIKDGKIDDEILNHEV